MQVDYDSVDKTVYVSGIGISDSNSMTDNDRINFWVAHETMPWDSLKDKATKVVFKRGIEKVPPGYFEGFNKVKTVCISETVTTIYTEVFKNCNNISKVYYEGSQTDKGDLAVYDLTLYGLMSDTTIWKCLEKDSTSYRTYSLLEGPLSLNGIRYDIIYLVLFWLYDNGEIGMNPLTEGWEFDLDNDGKYDLSLTQNKSSGQPISSGTLKTLDTASVDSWSFTTDPVMRTYCTEYGYYFCRNFTVSLFEYVDLGEECTLSLKVNKDYVYSGNPIRPAVVLRHGSKILTKGTNYVVCSYRRNTNVGQAQIIVNGQGRYFGKLSVNFNIVPKPVTPSVKITKLPAYNGGSFVKPEVQVTVDGVKLADTAYKMNVVSGGKYVGVSKAKLTLKGNYSGSKTFSYKIIPRAPSIKSVTGLKNDIIIYWTRQTTQCTGYEIEIASDAKFTNIVKTKVISKASSDHARQANLQSGKYYYVRMRAYMIKSGVKYYSRRSSIKRVQTK